MAGGRDSNPMKAPSRSDRKSLKTLHFEHLAHRTKSIKVQQNLLKVAQLVKVW